ncbi:hypothetical protein D3C84_933830 [compost metagenome]
MIISIKDFLRKLVNHRQEVRIYNRAVTNAPGVLELFAKHSRRGLVRLRREIDHEPFGPRRETAGCFAQHVGRVRVLAKQVQLVDQDDGGLLSADRVLIGGHYF